MAQKRRKKRSWLRGLLFYIFFPIFIWFVAFLVWFYWSELIRLIGGETNRSRSATKTSRQLDKSEKADPAPANRPREKILEEDRKSLEDILKRRQ
jgi:hypothetical protein